MRNSEKTISANSKGIIVSYGDVKKHMFASYNRSEYVRKIQLGGTKKYQKIGQWRSSRKAWVKVLESCK